MKLDSRHAFVFVFDLFFYYVMYLTFSLLKLNFNLVSGKTIGSLSLNIMSYIGDAQLAGADSMTVVKFFFLFFLTMLLFGFVVLIINSVFNYFIWATIFGKSFAKKDAKRFVWKHFFFSIPWALAVLVIVLIFNSLYAAILIIILLLAYFHFGIMYMMNLLSKKKTRVKDAFEKGWKMKWLKLYLMGLIVFIVLRLIMEQINSFYISVLILVLFFGLLRFFIFET